MMNTNTNRSFPSRVLAACLVGAMLYLSPTAHAEQAPRLQFVSGDVSAVDPAGQRRMVHKGDALRPGEKLVTGPGGMAQLRVFGQGVVALRGNSAVEISQPADGGFGVALDRGLVRTVTDLADRKGRIDVATPQGGFTVRGGDLQTAVGNGDNGDDSVVGRALSGDVTIRSAGGEQPAVLGRAVQLAGPGLPPRTLDVVPPSLDLRVPGRGPVPPAPAGRFEPAAPGPLAALPVTTRPLFGPGGPMPPGPAFDPRGVVPMPPPLPRPQPEKTYSFTVSRVSAANADPNLTPGQVNDLNNTLILSTVSNTGSRPLAIPTAPLPPETFNNLGGRLGDPVAVTGTGGGGVVLDPIRPGGPLPPITGPVTGTVTDGRLVFGR